MAGLERYFRDLSASRSAGGLPETSGYAALSNLLNEAGAKLRPRVRTVIHISNSGAGIPDGGFFTPDQLRQSPDESNLFELQPSRGVVEVKAPSEDLAQTARSEQVQRYLAHYGQVLITNYRDFALWHWENNAPRAGEAYTLSVSETAFWQLAAHPRNAHDANDERLLDYLRRVLLSLAPLSEPKVIAAFLASYAREARARVGETPLDALASVRTTLEEALGIQFTNERGRHFFQSTFIQTLFYGVFSAWVLWHEEDPTRRDRFRWRESHFSIGLPVLRKLFQLVADPQQLRTRGLEQVLDWTGDTLNRVDRRGFFTRFQLGEAVQYFYEPFLAEFDSELRTQFGVWFTPPDVVKYMVERVDRALREDLGIPGGFADRRVYVLDPCCGTGTYLFEVLRKIHAQVKEDSGEAQAGLQALEAARDRVFGFELLPAPYVVAHLRLDMLFKRWRTSFDPATGDRAAIFLTNALTGWEPPQQPQHHLLFPELEEERDAADRVKREPPILVILGNPPYSGFAGVAIEEERELSNAYRTTTRTPRPQGQGLNDLYVRFFRMAERRITPPPADADGRTRTAQGIVCFISNYSWLDGLSHPGMREHFLEAFDHIMIDCMNGDKFETGKRTPDGEPDPSVFSTDFNREGIQVGTAITTLVRKSTHTGTQFLSARASDAATADIRSVHYRDFWGAEKRIDLLRSLEDPNRFPFTVVKPLLELRLPFNPIAVYLPYFDWPLLTEVMPLSFPGVKTSRDDALVDIDRARLKERMDQYFDRQVSNAEIATAAPSLMHDTTQFDAVATRATLLDRGQLDDSICRFCYRPFDWRWLFWETDTRLIDRSRPEYRSQVFPGSVTLAAVQQNRKKYSPPLVANSVASLHLIERGANLFPLQLRLRADEHPALFATDRGTNAISNITTEAADYVRRMEIQDIDLFHHVVAILHSPRYGEENSGALRLDWPRIPLPNDRQILTAGARIGGEVTRLLDPDTAITGVTTGAIRPELRGIAELRTIDRTEHVDLSVNARWGYRQNGSVMPGPGRIETSSEHLYRVFLNATTFWDAIPRDVWQYNLGGYQVLKKWVSYREREILERPLRAEEAMEFTNNARRIAAMLALTPRLDEHYMTCRSARHFQIAD